MKSLLIAALISLAALPAIAAAPGEKAEMPDLRREVHTNVMKADRRAGDLFSARDLMARGLMADDIVMVTALPSGDRMPDGSSRGDY